MEYINAEEFLKQPKEVQRVFLDWWKKNYDEEDLVGYIGKSITYIKSFPNTLKHTAWDCFDIGQEIILLFTEGQLRKFIEDKTKGIVKVIQWNPCVDDNRYGYTIYILAKNEYKVLRHIEYKKLGTDLLQAYWKVACEIAKEC